MSRFVILTISALVLAACTTTAQNRQIDAGVRMGMAAAGVTVQDQPDICGKTFPDLEQHEGEEATSLLRRYVLYVRGPVNERVRTCYLFNKTQLSRLAAASEPE